MASSTWFKALSRQEQEAFKLQQFVPRSREVKRGTELLVVVYDHTYLTREGYFRSAYKVSERGRVQEIPKERFPATFTEDVAAW